MVRFPQELLKIKLKESQTHLFTSLKEDELVYELVDMNNLIADGTDLDFYSSTFPMCWEKVSGGDDLYLKYSDWYKISYRENGKINIVALFCINTRHPEFKIEKESLGDDDLIHIAEVEIAKEFRNSAYRPGGIKGPSIEDSKSFFVDFINKNHIYGEGPSGDTYENPHVLDNFFSVITTSAKKAGYKAITLMAVNTKVEELYLKKGFEEVDLSKYPTYRDNLDWYKQHPYMIKFL